MPEDRGWATANQCHWQDQCKHGSSQVHLLCAYLGSFGGGQVCGLQLLLQVWHTLCLCLQPGLVFMQTPQFCFESLLLSCVCSCCLQQAFKDQQAVVELLANFLSAQDVTHCFKCAENTRRLYFTHM